MDMSLLDRMSDATRKEMEALLAKHRNLLVA